MARNVQTSSNPSQATLKTFVGLLANAIFWVIVAIVLPIQAIQDIVPDLAPYTQWAPAVFYGLALLSFVRSLRVLQRLAASRTSPLERKIGGSSPRPPVGPKAAGSAGLPVVERRPTVQRMR